MQLFFVWLGAKRAAKNNVGRKGVLLDVAMRQGLPVPNGGILLESFYQLCLEEGVAVVQGECVDIPQPHDLAELLFTAVRFPQLKTNIAIRTPFSLKNEGQLPKTVSQFEIDPQNPAVLAAALSAAWTTLLPLPRRDLLLMEMVFPATTGTAYLVGSDQAEDKITVNAIDDTTDFMLPQLQGWGKGKTDKSAYAQRLQMLLRGVRRAFGDEVHKVVWVDDGQVCWLVELH